MYMYSVKTTVQSSKVWYFINGYEQLSSLICTSTIPLDLLQNHTPAADPSQRFLVDMTGDFPD